MADSPHWRGPSEFRRATLVPVMAINILNRSALYNTMSSMSKCLNIYQSGEYVGPRRDAGGDIQLMIPIEIPHSDHKGLLMDRE